jgi:hypothetical protein
MGKKINLDLCIRYLAFNAVFSNFDSYTGSGRNFYMYDDSGSGKFTLIPWDLHLSFGIYKNGWNTSTVDIVNYSNLDSRPLMKRIFANDSLRQIYFNYIKEFVNNEASDDSLASLLAHNKSILDSAASTDSNLIYTYSNYIKNIDSTIYIYVAGIKTAIPGLKPFCHNRDSIILAQIENYSPVSYNVKLKNSGGCQFKCGGFTGNKLKMTYNVTENSDCVKIGIYDCSGRLAKVFDEGAKNAGTYTNIWNAGNAPAGYYMVKASIGGKTAISTIVLTK